MTPSQPSQKCSSPDLTGRIAVQTAGPPRPPDWCCHPPKRLRYNQNDRMPQNRSSRSFLRPWSCGPVISWDRNAISITISIIAGCRQKIFQKSYMRTLPEPSTPSLSDLKSSMAPIATRLPSDEQAKQLPNNFPATLPSKLYPLTHVPVTKMWTVTAKTNLTAFQPSLWKSK